MTVKIKSIKSRWWGDQLDAVDIELHLLPCPNINKSIIRLNYQSDSDRVAK